MAVAVWIATVQGAATHIGIHRQAEDVACSFSVTAVAHGDLRLAFAIRVIEFAA